MLHITGSQQPWRRGDESLASMDEAFIENLTRICGMDKARQLLSRYAVRNLWTDLATGRRIDHAVGSEGYADPFPTFHHSAEEAFYLDGEAALEPEGDFVAGGYFWRPPGWVHWARSDSGFDALLLMEGIESSEGSGAVTRVPCELSQVGQDLLADSTERPSVGRGYVRNLSADQIPVASAPEAVGLLPAKGAHQPRARTLSANGASGAVTALIELADGWSGRFEARQRERFLFVIDGTLKLDGRRCGRRELAAWSAGSPSLDVRAIGATILFMKSGTAV